MKTDSILIFLTFFFFFCITAVDASAQEMVPEGYQIVDSVIYRPAAVMDSTLVGKDIFNHVSSNVSQTSELKDAMEAHIAGNADRKLSGYRVRIFFDNKQTARTECEETLKKFESLYHDVTAYRSYANPYCKVTVGDFRTRSEAMALLQRIRGEFPSAFVIKENIEFPVVDKENAYVTDTIKILRPIAQ